MVVQWFEKGIYMYIYYIYYVMYLTITTACHQIVCTNSLFLYQKKMTLHECGVLPIILDMIISFFKYSKLYTTRTSHIHQMFCTYGLCHLLPVKILDFLIILEHQNWFHLYLILLAWVLVIKSLLYLPLSLECS